MLLENQESEGDGGMWESDFESSKRRYRPLVVVSLCGETTVVWDWPVVRGQERDSEKHRKYLRIVLLLLFPVFPSRQIAFDLR